MLLITLITLSYQDCEILPPEEPYLLSMFAQVERTELWVLAQFLIISCSSFHSFPLWKPCAWVLPFHPCLVLFHQIQVCLPHNSYSLHFCSAFWETVLCIYLWASFTSSLPSTLPLIANGKNEHEFPTNIWSFSSTATMQTHSSCFHQKRPQLIPDKDWEGLLQA